MMSHICGCYNLPELMRFGLLALFLAVVFAFGLPAKAEDDDGRSSLFGLTSREDMLQMAGYGEEKLSTVLVTGSVLCKACLHGEPRAWPLSGAVVAVNCRTHKSRNSNSIQGTTDEYGDFMIDLPSHIHAMPQLEKKCTVTLLHLPKNSPCRPAYVQGQKGIKLSSFGNGIRAYDAGAIEIVHSKAKPSEACIKKESTYIQKQI